MNESVARVGVELLGQLKMSVLTLVILIVMVMLITFLDDGFGKGVGLTYIAQGCYPTCLILTQLHLLKIKKLFDICHNWKTSSLNILYSAKKQ